MPNNYALWLMTHSNVHYNLYTCVRINMYVHLQNISSKMTELTLPLYSRNQKRQYGELRVGVQILRGKVCVLNDCSMCTCICVDMLFLLIHTYYIPVHF